MATIGTLAIKIEANTTALERGLASAEQSVKAAGRAMQNAGKVMTAGITAPLIGIAAMATKAGTALDREMGNVQSLGLAAERTRELKTAVQDLAIEAGKSTTDVAQGLYQVVSAFGDSADTARILETNVKAAAAGLATVNDAIALTSAVTKGYGDTSAEAVQHASDLAFVTVQLGQTSFPELAASIGRVVPLASALAVAQEELFAVMATATGVTGGASEVSTQLRGILQSLMAPTADMTNLFKAMNVETGAAMLQQYGLIGAIQAIVAAAEASGTPLQKFIGSIEGQTLALALAGPLADDYTEKLGAMENAAGATDAAFRAQTEGINAAGFAAQQAGIRWEVFLQKINDGLGPAKLAALDALEPIAEKALALADAFANANPKLQFWIVTAAAAAAAAGPLLMALGSLTVAASALVSPAGLVVAAVAAIGAAAWLAYPYLQQMGILETVAAWATNAATALTNAATALAGMVQGLDAATIEEIKTQATTQVAEVTAHVQSLAVEFEAAFETGSWAGIAELARSKTASVGEAIGAGLADLQQTALLAAVMGMAALRMQANAAIAQAEAFVDESGIRAWVERTTAAARQWVQSVLAESGPAAEFVQRNVDRVAGVVNRIQTRMGEVGDMAAAARFNAAVASILETIGVVNATKTDVILTATGALTKGLTALMNLLSDAVSAWDAEAITTALAASATALSEGIAAVFDPGNFGDLGTASGNLSKAISSKLGEMLGSETFATDLGVAVGTATAAIVEAAAAFVGNFMNQISATDITQFQANVDAFVQNFLTGVVTGLAQADWSGIGTAIKDAILLAIKSQFAQQTPLETLTLGPVGKVMGAAEQRLGVPTWGDIWSNVNNLFGRGNKIEATVEATEIVVPPDIEAISCPFSIEDVMVDPTQFDGGLPAVNGALEIQSLDLTAVGGDASGRLPVEGVMKMTPAGEDPAMNAANQAAEALNSFSFSWPSLPEWVWPAYPAWRWPSLPRWVWPSIPRPSWIGDLQLPRPGWLGELLAWSPVVTVRGGMGATGPAVPVGANAAGTPYWRGGLSLVGEEGPELVNLPRGAAVFSADETRAMLEQPAPVTVNVSVAKLAGDLDEEALAYRIAGMIRRRA